MPEPHFGAIITILGLFTLNMISPGANFLVVVRSSLLGGRAAGVATGFGVAAGNTLYATISFLGLAALAPQGEWQTVLRVLGSLYLIRLGLITMRQRVPLDANSGKPQPSSKGAYFRTGLITELTNPQSITFFTGVAAASALPATPLWVPLLTVAAIVTISLTWRTSLALLFSTPSATHLYPRLSRYGNPLIGTLLLLLAAMLLSRELHP